VQDCASLVFLILKLLQSPTYWVTPKQTQLQTYHQLNPALRSMAQSSRLMPLPLQQKQGKAASMRICTTDTEEASRRRKHPPLRQL